MEQEILLCLTQTVFNDGTAASMANMNAATGKLKSYERSNVTEFVPALHKILGRTDIDPAILQSCATLFKNLVRLHWNESNEVFPEAIRVGIRRNLLPLTCSTPRLVRLQLSEALAIISTADFPDQWPTLTAELVSHLQSAVTSGNMASTSGVLDVAAAVFQRFPDAPDTSDTPLRLALKQALDTFAAPLTQVFTTLAAHVLGVLDGGGRPDPLALGALKTACTCFFQLNWVDLPEYFEDHLGEWMGPFHRFLLPRAPGLGGGGPSPEEPGPLEALQAGILECLDLYADKYEEEFEPHLGVLVGDLWSLLSTMPPQAAAAPASDTLVAKGVRLLATLLPKPAVVGQFVGDEALLRGILARIVTPNMRLRATDLEALEDSPGEYIAGDIEGSDAETRRRVASDLLRAMIRAAPAKVVPLALECVGACIGEYEGDKGSREVAKDCAVALLSALAVKTSTQATGVVSLNEGVPLGEFLASQVLPELADPDPHARPLAKAACIKFVSSFRGLFAREQLNSLLPTLARLMESRHYLVHTYAAAALERILTVKTYKTEGGGGVAGAAGGSGSGSGSGSSSSGGATTAPGAAPPASEPRVSMEVLTPLATPILATLFTRMTSPGYGENEYLMRCVMRVVTVGKGAGCTGAVGSIAGGLSAILHRVCRNPSNPTFNHFMFESLASLMRTSCTARPELVGEFEGILFPAAEVVLAGDVLEFLPYMFQLLAQALDLRPPGAPLSPPFQALLPRVLSPTPWSRKSSVPALTSLLKAYLAKGAGAVVGLEGGVVGVLSIWRALTGTRGQETLGFSLFDAAIVHLPPPTLAPHLRGVVEVMLGVVQASRSAKIAAAFIHSASLMAGIHGPEALSGTLGALGGGGLLPQLLEAVFAPLAGKVVGGCHRRETAIGLTRLLCETPALWSGDGGAGAPAAAAMWTKTLGVTIGLLGAEGVGAAPPSGAAAAAAAAAGGAGGVLSRAASLGGAALFMEDEDLPKEEEGPPMEYTSSYNRLVYCAIPYVYAFPTLPPPAQYLSQSLARTLALHPLVATILSANPALAAQIAALPK